jgi:hypothetical protein
MAASARIPLDRREEFTQMGMRLLRAELGMRHLAIEAEPERVSLDVERLAFALEARDVQRGGSPHITPGNRFYREEAAALLALMPAQLSPSTGTPERCDRIVNNGMSEPTECGRTLPCERHSDGAQEAHGYNGGTCCDLPLVDHQYADAGWVAEQDWYGPVGGTPETGE